MKTIVIKLSGILFSLNSDISRIKKITKILEEINRKGFKIIAIAGGGIIARNIQNTARTMNADEAFLDQIGIDVSRLNAKLMIASTTKACQHIPKNLDEVVNLLISSNMVFSGGFSPGQSTNATAALIAERTKAKLFINTTDVDGVFTSDPIKNKKATLIKSITITDLFKKLNPEIMKAGTYDLMDMLSLKIIERSKIPTVIIKCDSTRIKSSLSGQFIGTKITFSKL